MSISDEPFPDEVVVVEVLPAELVAVVVASDTTTVTVVFDGSSSRERGIVIV